MAKKIFDFTKAKEKMKQVDIVEYIRFKGYPVVKRGNSYGIEGYSSFVISTKNNEFYYNAMGVYGDCANFEMWAENVDFTVALKNVLENVGKDISNFEHKRYEHRADTTFILPEKANTYKNVYAYLNKTRKISTEIIDKMIDEKYLYQDINNNCIFVSYDENGAANFATRRGTYSDIKFHGDVANGDYNYCIQIPPKDKTQVSILVVMESVIDALSVMDMIKNYGLRRKDIGQVSFLVLCGSAKYNLSIEKFFELYHNIYRVIIMTDNDAAGLKSAHAIENIVGTINNKIDIQNFQPQYTVDWNEELCYLNSSEDAFILGNAKERFCKIFKGVQQWKM